MLTDDGASFGFYRISKVAHAKTNFAMMRQQFPPDGATSVAEIGAQTGRFRQYALGTSFTRRGIQSMAGITAKARNGGIAWRRPWISPS